MKRQMILFLTLMLASCSNVSNTSSSSLVNSESSTSSSLIEQVFELSKEDYSNAYGEVADILFMYKLEQVNSIKRQMDLAENNEELMMIAIMMKMFSEVYISDKFTLDPLDTVTIKGQYEDADMEFNLLSSYEDGYINGAIRCYSDVFAPNESFHFIKIEFDYDSSEIKSFDSYSDYNEDDIEYSYYKNDEIYKLNLENIDQEYNDINVSIQTMKETFKEKIQNSLLIEEDFSTEISNVIEYNPYE